MKYKLIILLTVVLASFASCDKNDDIEYTASGILAGTWWVEYEVESAPGVWENVSSGYVPFLTYNTAANVASEMFVDDLGEFWDFKAKVKANPEALKFGDDVEVENLSYEDCKIKVTDGEVLFGLGTSKTGIATDSICFYVQFSDDDAKSKYKVSGHKRTGWPDDEY